MAVPTDMAADTFVIVTARNEADRLAATLSALARAFVDAPVFVADDGSTDETTEVAVRAGATVLGDGRSHGKGETATLAARAVLERLRWDSQTVALLCDADLGDSAALLAPLVAVVRERQADLAVAAFSRRVGGGFGLALAVARWAIRARCGLTARAPLSGQRALRADALGRLLPFAPGFGMEVGMTIDAVSAGLRVTEIELDLAHRATGRSVAGFLHRGRQLLDVVRAYLGRR